MATTETFGGISGYLFDHFNMPPLALSGGGHDIPAVMLHALTGRYIAHEPTARIFALNLVRLTDVAVREYETAQTALKLHAREWRHGNFSSYFEGVVT